MLSVYKLSDAKASLSKIIDRVASGEQIVVSRHGKPIAKIVPLSRAAMRAPGGWEGQVYIADDFDDALPESVLNSFYGEES